ncbi:PH domain-containing protein [Pacificimonas sp. WHA3]|uniref:PH domain-containing protein n=1 Tax=Pacificimonas pallii TaxID=2827236 RepID=A0ABS6SH73_9SPHN|nr:PH domain-containing protein [Pacificimonas pallii]MBV7257773.1 PH domain-containing protein [Pacificimonas pallii]
MGLFSSHEITPGEIQEKFGQHLLPDENVLAAFKTIRDIAFLTDLRFVMIDVQGLTGSKVDVASVPYKSITRFSVESAGTLDLDTDMKIWVSSRSQPFEVKISRKSDPALIQRLLAERVLAHN